jgi:sigma-B regulation protein RsbU (phosphoserine phosphatase)
MPIGRMKKLIVARLLSFLGTACLADLLQIRAQPLAHGLYWPTLFVVMGTAVFVARIKRPRLFLPLDLLMFLGLLLGYLQVRASPTVPITEADFPRILADTLGALIGMHVGYRVLFSFNTTEGLHQVRMNTELSLAHGIQETLVPTLSLDGPGFEVYGRSLPSKEMGGDLIDVISTRDGGLLVYIADISGHGLPAGQLMGMLKAAMRMAFQFQHTPTSLLESADRVLPAVKTSDMYATLALLSFDNSMEAEYAIAGHPAILHYRADSRDVERLSMEQFPLGLIPGSNYASARVAFAQSDMFLMLTDGIPDAANERDEEFGLDRVEQILISNAAEPLSQIWDSVISAARRHGPPEDDQTLLLLRVRESPAPGVKSTVLD